MGEIFRGRPKILGHLTSIAPYQGKTKAVCEVLKSAHGVAFPAPIRTTGKKGARDPIWSGNGLACGSGPDVGLVGHRCVNGSVGCLGLRYLVGARGGGRFGGLVPVDLRAAHFKCDYTARSQFKHMNGSITRIGADGFLILVLRSMALTLVRDPKEAMEGVATRG